MSEDKKSNKALRYIISLLFSITMLSLGSYYLLFNDVSALTERIWIAYNVLNGITMVILVLSIIIALSLGTWSDDTTGVTADKYLWNFLWVPIYLKLIIEGHLLLGIMGFSLSILSFPIIWILRTAKKAKVAKP